TVVNSTLSGDLFDVQGGAISNGGRLSVLNSIFHGGFGGFILNGGTAVVNNSTFTENRFEEGPGGAIWNAAGSMIIRNSTFSENLAIHGGAIYNEASMTILNSTASDNAAGLGGGLFNTETGTLTITG